MVVNLRISGQIANTGCMIYYERYRTRTSETTQAKLRFNFEYDDRWRTSNL